MARPAQAAPWLAPSGRVLAKVAFVLLCVVGVAYASSGGLRYTGRVLYRINKAPVSGVLVELVEAEDDGQPTDEVLGSTRADADGRFAVVLSQPMDKNVALVASAVQDVAVTGGDRRGEGYEIKTHRTQLGFLPHPSATKANILLITRHQPDHSAAE